MVEGISPFSKNSSFVMSKFHLFVRARPVFICKHYEELTSIVT